jgi:hypothetical protein
MVLPQTLGGIYVPKTVADELDNLRFAELRHQCDMADNLWGAFALACERGDKACVDRHAQQIAILTRTALALVKRLGQAEPDDARQ